MVHHKQQLLAKPAQELSHDPCRVPESISRMTPYGFHNKLGYVNCKGVLEYYDICVEALGHRDHFALAGGQLHGVRASASMLLHCRE
jgi:hypothetical protein